MGKRDRERDGKRGKGGGGTPRGPAAPIAPLGPDDTLDEVETLLERGERKTRDVGASTPACLSRCPPAMALCAAGWGPRVP